VGVQKTSVGKVKEKKRKGQTSTMSIKTKKPHAPIVMGDMGPFFHVVLSGLLFLPRERNLPQKLAAKLRYNVFVKSPWQVF